MEQEIYRLGGFAGCSSSQVDHNFYNQGTEAALKSSQKEVIRIMVMMCYAILVLVFCFVFDVYIGF